MAIAIFSFVFAVLPGWLIPSSEFQHPHSTDASTRIQRQNEVRATAIQALAGLVLVFGAFYTARNYQLSKEGQLTDRLRSAVDQIHTGEVAAIGGLVALGRLASDSNRDRRNIVELMATYVRMQAPLPEVVPPLGDDRPALDSVLQTALTTIARRYTGASDTRVLDLSSSFLRGADLRFAALPDVYMERSDLASARLAGMSAEKADLTGANLTSVDATEARLRGAKLPGADLTKAIMSSADLRDAILPGAHLSRVFLTGACLARCEMSDAIGDEALFFQANLEDALMLRVNLPKAFLVGAKLNRVILCGAELPGAFMQQADLRGADLEGADLRDADLREADLRGANCTGTSFLGADLRGARFAGVVLQGANLEGAIRDSGDPPLVAKATDIQMTAAPVTAASPDLEAHRILRLLLRIPPWRADEAYMATVRRALVARRRL